MRPHFQSWTMARQALIYYSFIVLGSAAALLLCSAQPQNQSVRGGSGFSTSSSSGSANWGQGFGGTVAAVKNKTSSSSAGATYYWGSHQVGESVLAFSKDRFTSPHPVNVHRTITYQNQQSRITYLEVFVRNAVSPDQVYVSSGGIGANFIAVYVGTQRPTTYFEYKATLYGFEWGIWWFWRVYSNNNRDGESGGTFF